MRDGAPQFGTGCESGPQGGDGVGMQDSGTTRSQSSRPRGKHVSTDAIVVLKKDHQEIRRVFRRFEQTSEGARATRAKLVDQMLELLTIHTFIENECMYPRVRELMPDLEADVLESYEEHHVADVLCMELAAMSPDDERFTAKTRVLIENVMHHMREEEDEWFPKVRGGLGRKHFRNSARRCSTSRRPHRGAQASQARSRRPWTRSSCSWVVWPSSASRPRSAT